MGFEIKIDITGNLATLSLFEASKNKIVSEMKWEDKRDLSNKFFQKPNLLLKKNNISIKDVKKISFDCDSPYFSGGKKGEIRMEELDSTGKCGFTAWQTGEIISKAINFALDK